MRPSRIAVLLAFLALAACLAGTVPSLAPRADEGDQSYLASLISQALSTPSTQVRIGRLDGALSSDATLYDLSISDKDGVWLKLDRARLIWTRAALLSRRLEIDKLEIGKLEIQRNPIPSDEPTPQTNAPLLPELPVKVEVKDFSLAELAIGQPLFGVAVRFTASGAANLGNPAQGLELHFDARRLDAPGVLSTRLSFVPQTEALSLDLKLDEPQGGFLAKLARLPEEPPVKLDLTGHGTLDAFRAALRFDAGPTIGAEGTARLAREGGVRHLLVDVASRITGLLPVPVAPAFAGETKLRGDVTFADAGGIDIAGFSIASSVAKLDLSGRIDAERNLDLRLSAGALPAPSGTTRAGEVQIGKLAIEGTVKGPLGGPSIAASLDLEEAKTPQLRLGKLSADFTATARSDGAAPKPVTLEAKAKADGVALTDAALAAAVGDRLSFTLHGTANSDGTADFDLIEASLQTAHITYAGRLGAADIRGRLVGNVPDLSRFSRLAATKLAGSAVLKADLEGSPRAGGVSARLDMEADRLSLGQAAADRLFGGVARGSGIVKALPRGAYAFEALRLSGRHVALTLDGNARPSSIALTAKVELPRLAYVDERLTGRAYSSANVTGSFAHPDLHVEAALADATGLGRPIPRLGIVADLRDPRDALDARAKLDGIVDGKAASGKLHLARLPDDAWQLDGLSLAIGSASLIGDLALDARRFASGNLAFKARDLDDLTPLLLTRLSGSAEAALTLAAQGGRQDMKLVARASSVKAAAIVLGNLSADAQIADLYGSPIINAGIGIDQLTVAGQTFSKIRLDANGSTAASDFSAQASALGFELSTRGRFLPQRPMRVEIASFEAKRGGRSVALVTPASATFEDDGVLLANLALAVQGGRITLDGKVGEKLDLRLAARNVPLAAADIFVPGLGLTGTLEANATLAGTRDAPMGPFRVAVTRLSSAQATGAGLPPVDAKLDGELADNRAKIDGRVDIGRYGAIELRGSVPLSITDPVDLAATGRIDAAITDPLLGPASRRLTGAGAIDLRARGTVAKPELSGKLSLSRGSFSDFSQGVQLNDLQITLSGNKDRLALEEARATTRNGGTLRATGDVRIDPAAAFPGAIRITGQRAELVSNPFVTAIADLDLSLAGALARDPRIGGHIDLESVTVSVAERLPISIRPLSDIRHLNPPKEVAARLAAERKARLGAGARRAVPFNPSLDVSVASAGGINVRGRGLEAELGGSVKLTGTLGAPNVVGAFNLHHGDLNLVGNRLDFTRGHVTFSGGLVPELDFLAEARAAEVTATVAVTGPASAPQFAFSSQPQLPQDEILSRILFARASGTLSPFQALQLAQAAAQFSSDSGEGPLGSLGKSFGLGSGDGGSGGLLGRLPNAVSKRVRIGVQTGATAGETGVSVDVDLTKHIRLRGEADANGATSIGIGTEWER
ncbi:MAG: translocation/assembly module TamB domain-containing protein [Hyphomicrobiales bacterium]|nr:translocation/assembly module TamB domain-containing protein [Hyphomicrobiales bacterium]